MRVVDDLYLEDTHIVDREAENRILSNVQGILVNTDKINRNCFLTCIATSRFLSL